MAGKKWERISPPPADLNWLVAVAADFAGQHGIRAAAREIGLSPTGLTQVLTGNHPYAPTLKKLRRFSKKIANGSSGT